MKSNGFSAKYAVSLVTMNGFQMRREVSYNSETGKFTRLRLLAHNTKQNADRLLKIGYCMVHFGKARFYSHRLAWLFVYGEWPPNEIDHINGHTDDNRISNLRLATRAENGANVVKAPGKSGFRYVQRVGNRYRALITVQAKPKHVGYFDTPAAAHAAAVNALAQAKGEFSPTSRIAAA